MIRGNLLRGSRAFSQYVSRTQTPVARYVRPSTYVPATRHVYLFPRPHLRHYSAPTGLAKPEVEGRILDILKNFDKVRPIHEEVSITNARTGPRCF
jgi:NADH dehydrogenase (ubiquinone) 1 alpha/beta subcomplex 1, acyl-carrier protein